MGIGRGVGEETSIAGREGAIGRAMTRAARQRARGLRMAGGAGRRSRRGQGDAGRARPRAFVTSRAAVCVVDVEERTMPRSAQGLHVVSRSARIREARRMDARARARRTRAHPRDQQAPLWFGDSVAMARPREHVLHERRVGREHEGGARGRTPDEVAVALEGYAAHRCKACMARRTACADDRADPVLVGGLGGVGRGRRLALQPSNRGEREGDGDGSARSHGLVPSLQDGRRTR